MLCKMNLWPNEVRMRREKQIGSYALSFFFTMTALNLHKITPFQCRFRNSIQVALINSVRRWYALMRIPSDYKLRNSTNE